MWTEFYCTSVVDNAYSRCWIFSGKYIWIRVGINLLRFESGSKKILIWHNLYPRHVTAVNWTTGLGYLSITRHAANYISSLISAIRVSPRLIIHPPTRGIVLGEGSVWTLAASPAASRVYNCLSYDIDMCDVKFWNRCANRWNQPHFLKF